MGSITLLLVLALGHASYEGAAQILMEHSGRSVLVTGAGGRTGVLLLEALCGQKEFSGVYALVRSPAKAADLEQRLAAVPGKVTTPHVVVGDIRNPSTYSGLMKGMDALVILTSSTPLVTPWSNLRAKIKLALGFKKVRRSFYYPRGQSPREVDWLGQKAQIDAAKAAGVQHVVLVGSMAGTIPNHFLNTLGRGNILRWKRKAERYLIRSGIPYTIIHPGGLLDTMGGRRELVLGVDDQLLETKFTLVPREDVAHVCLESLLTEEAKSRAFDLGSRPEGEGTPWAGNLKPLLAALGGRNCAYDEPEWP